MNWVTRRRIQVNRTATAWLIRRFIDSQATFLFVDPDEVAHIQEQERATGFDAPGATYPHEDPQGRCSFEALVAEKFPDDPVLVEMGRIVHGADFEGAEDHAPEALGLRMISRGFPLITKNDREALEKATFIYDALYASLAARRAAASKESAGI